MLHADGNNHASSVYTVNFLGSIQNMNLSGKNSRDGDVLLIDRIEDSQVLKLHP